MAESIPKPQNTGAFQAYWEAYGGLRCLLRSTYLWLGFGLVLFLWPAWMTGGNDKEPAWVETCLQILPSMVAFSLGSLAIILSMSTSPFLKAIRQGGNPRSPYMKFVATFFHFILLQLVSVILGIICRFVWYDWLSFAGCWIFFYALLSGIAAAAALMKIAQLRNYEVVIED